MLPLPLSSLFRLILPLPSHICVPTYSSACPPTCQVDSITIPVGPRLGDKVLEVDGVSKAYGDRLLLDNVSFSIPPGKAYNDT
jgi:ABC-type multidrug transport system fused ATPase/permease subunit